MADVGARQTAAESENMPAAIDMTSLVHEHHAAVYRYACRLCGCSAEAEDLTQQTFLTAHQRLTQLREPARARAWLLAVVRSCFLKSLRRKRPAPAQNFDFNMDEVADRAPAVSHVDRDELYAALGELPDDFRLILLMFYFEELSYYEIAQELQLPIGTVMSRLSRAKRHLRNKLAPTWKLEPPSPALVRPALAPGFITASHARAVR
jgi:RNA polymerase sigma-70 factor (ECF subfamily)